jgi:hypothetical protein
MFDINLNNTFNLNFDFFKCTRKKKKPVCIRILKKNIETYNHELNLEDSFFFIIDDKMNFIHSQKIPNFLNKRVRRIKTIDDVFPESIANFYKSLIICKGNRINKKMIIEIDEEKYLLVIDTLLQMPNSYASMLAHIPYNDIELNGE